MKRTVRAFNPGPKAKRPCFVCGRHRLVSQTHHLIEVAKVAGVLHVMAIWDWAPGIPSVSLCPTHHAYEHAIRRLQRNKRMESEEARELGRDLSDREWDRLVEVDNLRAEAHDSVWREVRDEFLRREKVHKTAQSAEGEGG